MDQVLDQVLRAPPLVAGLLNDRLLLPSRRREDAAHPNALLLVVLLLLVPILDPNSPPAVPQRICQV